MTTKTHVSHRRRAVRRLARRTTTQHGPHSGRRDTRQSSRGWAPLELLFMTAVIMTFAAMALALFGTIYASQAASRAAWDAARAYSLGQSAVSAANNSLPGAVQLMDVRTLGDGVEVTVRPPNIFPVLELPEITRTAYIP